MIGMQPAVSAEKLGQHSDQQIEENASLPNQKTHSDGCDWIAVQTCLQKLNIRQEYCFCTSIIPAVYGTGGSAT